MSIVYFCLFAGEPDISPARGHYTVTRMRMFGHVTTVFTGKKDFPNGGHCLDLCRDVLVLNVSSSKN